MDMSDMMVTLTPATLTTEKKGENEEMQEAVVFSSNQAPEEKEKTPMKYEVVGNVAQIGRKVFNVREVTKDQVALIRKKKIPAIIIKEYDHLYFAKINPKNPVCTTPCHMCSDTSHDCCHLLARHPDEGGCMKVVNFAKYIESYPFIERGYETIGTVKDAFIVWKCNNYSRGRAPRTKSDIREYVSML